MMMKQTALVLLFAACASAQISSIAGSDTFPQARTKINNNFSYLNTQVGLKAALSHVHLISDVTDLQTTLDGKAASGHNHDAVYQALSVILTQFSALSCADGQIPKRVSGAWQCDADLTGGGEGSGDVIGPASSVNGRFASFNGITGKAIADSGYSAASFEPANANIQSHISNTSNPHSTTAAQVGAIATGNAYTDLSNALKIGTGATQVAAGNHNHTGT